VYRTVPKSTEIGTVST